MSLVIKSEKWTTPNLSDFVFRVADIKLEEAKILRCRWKGYRRYGFRSPEDCRDRYDDYAAHYVCEKDGEIVGCIRMVSARKGKFELQAFVDISAWLKENKLTAELTRFSIPLHRRMRDIKFGLWKLAWLNAAATSHTGFIVWSIREKLPMYRSLGFEGFPGQEACFSHAGLKNRKHWIMTLDFARAENLYRHLNPHLYHFFCELKHPNIF